MGESRIFYEPVSLWIRRWIPYLAMAGGELSRSPLGRRGSAMMRSRATFPVRPFDLPPVQVVEAAKRLFLRRGGGLARPAIALSPGSPQSLTFDPSVWSLSPTAMTQINGDGRRQTVTEGHDPGAGRSEWPGRNETRIRYREPPLDS